MSIKGFLFVLPTLVLITEELSYFPKSRVCYEKYGCFNSHPNRRLVKLPQSPSRIGTRFNLFTRNNRNSARLIDDRNKYKLTASHFKISRRTILVIHGFRESINTWAKDLKTALLSREDCNVILVDWPKGAKGPNYPQAAGNTRLVGVQTAELIRFLINSTSSGSASSIDRFYIVGFSLGAQVAGYAGSYLRARGMILGRITGLDPAGPLFTIVSSDYRLDASDASYVDVVHTNAGLGQLGTNRRAGHTDFYPNGGTNQPGCNFASCSHTRAPRYFISSVRGSCSWTAYPCASYWEFEQRKCLTCNGACPSMGFDADCTKKRGRFYLKTNSKAPFCTITQWSWSLTPPGLAP